MTRAAARKDFHETFLVAYSSQRPGGLLADSGGRYGHYSSLCFRGDVADGPPDAVGRAHDRDLDLVAALCSNAAAFSQSGWTTFGRHQAWCPHRRSRSRGGRDGHRYMAPSHHWWSHCWVKHAVARRCDVAAEKEGAARAVLSPGALLHLSWVSVAHWCGAGYLVGARRSGRPTSRPGIRQPRGSEPLGLGRNHRLRDLGNPVAHDPANPVRFACRIGRT